jgi:hypothetical protein
MTRRTKCLTKTTVLHVPIVSGCSFEIADWVPEGAGRRPSLCASAAALLETTGGDQFWKASFEQPKYERQGEGERCFSKRKTSFTTAGGAG